MGARERLAEAADQARRDLDELEVQVETGEIDETTAAELRAGYLSELEATTEALTSLDLADDDAPEQRAPRRMIAGAIILVVALAVTIGVAATLAQDRTTGPLEGVAGEEMDLESISNEAMEAVLAASRDDPAVADQIPYMEFRLAERYFEEGDYSKAFDHYQQIISSDPPQDVFVQSMTRVGWLVWLLNDETELAIQTIDRALQVDPTSPLPLYVKGQILWCGMGDVEAALPLFQQVLATPGLDAEVVAQVEDDIAVAQAGGACSA